MSGELDERERERVRGLVSLHKEYFPDGDPFFRALYELGMVPGWRALRWVGPANNKEKS